VPRLLSTILHLSMYFALWMNRRTSNWSGTCTRHWWQSDDPEDDERAQRERVAAAPGLGRWLSALVALAHGRRKPSRPLFRRRPWHYLDGGQICHCRSGSSGPQAAWAGAGPGGRYRWATMKEGRGWARVPRISRTTCRTMTAA